MAYLGGIPLCPALSAPFPAGEAALIAALAQVRAGGALKRYFSKGI